MELFTDMVIIIISSIVISILCHALIMAIINSDIRQYMINNIISIPNPCGRRIAKFLITIGYPMHLLGIQLKKIFFKVCPNDKK